MSRFLVLAALALVLLPGVTAQYCLNEQGEAVDWWVIVKVPRIKASGDAGVVAGTAYLYGDAKSYLTPSSFWTNSTLQISDPQSAAGQTIQQIYDNASKTSTNGYVMYNDETPGGTTSESYGHSKGMIAWSAASSFWLIHSVPKYADSPDNVQSYVYPSTGEEYGQSMLCLSLDIANVDQAFLQFQYTNPQVYGSQWVSSLASQMPNGNAFVNQGTVVTDATSNIVNITTVGGRQFMHFAKTVAWGKSIFGDLIGSYYGEDMVVETWQRPYEDPLLPPATSVGVYSVLDIAPPSYAEWDGIGWKESQDHAKWGVVTDASVPVLCIGDINKQKSQWARSGGMACIMDQVLYSAWKGLIVDTDENGKKPMEEVKTGGVFQPIALE